jgi:pilus assembly protein Flp/PilA
MIHKEHFLKEDGQGLVEYALILGLVAIAIIGIMTLFGEQAKNVYCRTVHQLAPDADISSACQSPIVMPRLVASGSNFINVEAHVYDPDGNQNKPYAAITKVEFYIDSTDSAPVLVERAYRYCLGSGNGSCSNFNIGSLSSGPHEVIIMAYDKDGNIGTSTFRFKK